MAAAVIVPIAFTGDDKAPTTTMPSNPSTTREAPNIPKEKRSPRPEDRDLAEITAALRQIDPCQLFDLAVARQRQRPNAAPIPLGPHACLLAGSADAEPGDGAGLELDVGTLSDQIHRYGAAPVVLSGARTYEISRRSSSGSKCEVVIPVSFVRAIELSYDTYGDADVCPVVRQYAAATVVKLRDPDAVAYRDTTRPFSAWDGCSLLKKMIGAKSGDYTYEPHGLRDPFGGCRAAGEPGGELKHEPSIEIGYGRAPDPLGETRRIGDKTVEFGAREKSCYGTWDNGPSGSRNPWYSSTVVSVWGENCDSVAAMVAQAIALAGQQPDAGNVKPYRPLLFGPDDNDTGSVGACVDFAGGGSDCEPYQEVPVPDNPDDLMTAPQVNRHVQCAVFLDAVGARFGTQFAPITWGDHCFFVDHEHTLRIRVNVDAVNRPSEYGADPTLWMAPDETEIAGKAAVTFWDIDKNTFDIYLSPHDDIDLRGNLHISVEMIGGRGKETEVAPALPKDKADLATEVMTQVVEKFFR